jgi:guanyl-specific ribonuclease Sa
MRWLRLATLIAIAAIVVYQSWENERRPPIPNPAADSPSAAEAPPTDGDHDPTATPSTLPASETPTSDRLPEPPASQTIVKQQTIRDSHGHIVYRGDIDLSATLERIRRGDHLDYSHDGTRFENREHRLPRQSAGYYHEFVHPTPHVSGPGPQRIVIGEGGEVYYTPDHYRTFRRLDSR